MRPAAMSHFAERRCRQGPTLPIMDTLRAGESERAVAASARETPVVAIAGVIVSMLLVAVGNGLMFAYIPVRLGAAGLPPTWAGSILTGLSLGGIAACFLTGPMVRRVGHARAYMTFSAFIVLSHALVAVGVDPWLWLAARGLYGFAICGLFIVAQSWLNDAVANRIRGRIMATFYVAYVVGLGLGSLTRTAIDAMGNGAPVMAIVFAALSIVPVGLTTLRPPPPPAVASPALGRAWRISPVGVAGMMAVGGLSMMVAGFAPIHATASGFSKDEVAWLLVCMEIGTILFQLPFGWISDRTDRRFVLVATSLLVACAGIVASQTQGAPYLAIVLVFVVWSGSTESIYSISNAHANDRAGQEDLVGLSSAMLFAWSISGFIIPALATVLTAFFGTQAFMYVAVAIAVGFAGFVVARIRQAPGVRGPSGGFSPMSAQAPVAADLAYPSSAVASAPKSRS